MDNKYLNAFEKATNRALWPNSELGFELIGDCLLVEEIKDDQFSKQIKTDDGRTVHLELSSSSSKNQINGIGADKPTFVRVLMVGQGRYNEEEGTLEPWDVETGDIVLVGATSIKKFSVFGKIVTYGDTVIGLTRATDIQMRFKGQKGFDQFFELINQELNLEKK